MLKNLPANAGGNKALTSTQPGGICLLSNPCSFIHVLCQNKDRNMEINLNLCEFFPLNPRLQNNSGFVSGWR